MPAINRAQQGKLLRLGLRTVFGMAYKDQPLERDMVFENRTSNQAYEEDQLFYGTGYAIEKPEGSEVSFDTMGQGWTARYDHKTYALALRITEEAMEDNLYFKIASKGGKALARSLRLKQDVNAINVLNNATEPGVTYGDSKTLLATDRPLAGPDGGTFANTLSTQADMSEDALEELLILCRYCVDERGLPIMLTPDRMVASANLEFDLERLLKSTGRVQTSDNDLNALNSTGKFSQSPALLRLLTNDGFWGFTTKGHEGGLIHFTRRGMRMKNDDDFRTGDHLMKVDVRESNGVTDPRGFFGCDPS